MSKFYISNENGDWWIIETNTEGVPTLGGELYVIGESALKEVVYPYEIPNLDKLERYIQKHGEIVKVAI